MPSQPTGDASAPGLPDTYRGSALALRPGSSAGVHMPEVQPDRVDLRSFLGVFRRRQIMFVTIVLICVSLAILFTLHAPRLYSAEADVIVEQPDPVAPASTPNGVAPPQPPISQEIIATELQLISSRGLAGKVYDNLALANDPDFLAEAQGRYALSDTIKGWFGAAPLAPSDAAGRRRDAIDWLASPANLSASQAGTSNALRIVYTDRDPARSAAIANAFALAYTRDHVNAKAAGNQASIALLRTRLEALRNQAQADFGAVQDYRIRSDLLTNTATALTEQDISTYKQQVATAKAEASEDAARLAAARAQLASGSGSVGEAQALPVVQALRAQRAQLSITVADLSNRYVETHPDLIAARQKLTDIDAQIEAEIRRSLLALAAKAAASHQRLASLSGSLDAAHGKLAADNRAMVELADLTRKADASQSLYESYLGRYKESVARSGTEQPIARIVSQAAEPLTPSSPSFPLNIALGLLVGVLAGAAAAFAAENAHRGLATGEEVEERLGVRALGSVPLLDSLEHHSRDPLQTVADHPRGAFAESLRNILASSRQAANGRNQILAVTSALPGEGKTTLAACMARAAALGGERVVVIDCDPVRRQLSRGIGSAAGEPGLREVLHGTATIADALRRDVGSAAAILPITSAFEQGQRLLDKGALHRVLAKLREDYDLILLDCAPVLPIAETREVATLADNVVLVARWRKTPDFAIRSAIKMLPLHTVSDIGVALNAVNMRRVARFGYGDPSFLYLRYKSYYEQPGTGSGANAAAAGARS